MRCRDPLQEAQAQYNRARYDQRQREIREGWSDWMLALSVLVFLVVMAVCQ